MYKVREIVTCKPGKVGELVKKFKALGEVIKGMGLEPFRIYTDLAGEEFWTLVLEREYENLSDWPPFESQVMSDDKAKSAMAGYHELVTGGRREVYKVEA